MGPLSRLLDPELVERLNQLSLSARRVVEGAASGPHRSPVKGVSVEFRQHRFYTPGDPLRRLDWRVLARSDRPYVREYDEETNLRSLLLLDTSGSMRYGRGPQRKLDYAARLAAALAYLMLGQAESVGLATHALALRDYLAPENGTPQLSRVLETLDRLVADGKGDLSAAVEQVAARLARRSLVIVVSDLMQPVDRIRPALARLRHRRHETILVRVLHRHEIDFPFRKWWRFRGAEGEPAVLGESAVLREAYRANFARHEQQLVDAARSLEAELLTLTTDTSLFDAVSSVVRRRRVTTRG
jgi:uncharacterized protein (DUF58 family)